MRTLFSHLSGVVIQGMGLQSDQYIPIYPICVASWVPGLCGLHWVDVCWLARPFRVQENTVRCLNLESIPSQDAQLRIQPQRYLTSLDSPLQGGLLMPQYKTASFLGSTHTTAWFATKSEAIYTFPSQNMSQALHDVFFFQSGIAFTSIRISKQGSKSPALSLVVRPFSNRFTVKVSTWS